MTDDSTIFLIRTLTRAARGGWTITGETKALGAAAASVAWQAAVAALRPSDHLDKVVVLFGDERATRAVRDHLVLCERGPLELPQRDAEPERVK